MILFILYLLKVSVCAVGLFAVYYLVFRNNTFHQTNRICLMFVILFSFIIPLIPLPGPGHVLSIAYVTSPRYSDLTTVAEDVRQQVSSNSGLFHSVVIWIYLAGVFILSYRFTNSIISLHKLGRKTSLERQRNFRIRRTHLKESFTFLNTIFLPKEETDTIVLQHEQTHVTQYHWVDLVVAEIAAIILWFNPVLIIVRNELRLQHEFLADRAVLSHGVSFENYAQCLLKNMNVKHFAVSATSPLYSTSIKKRMVMMTKKQTSTYKFIVYFLLIPACAILIMSFGQSRNAITSQVGQIALQNLDENIPDIAPVDLTKVTKVVLYGERKDPAPNQMRHHTGIDFELMEGSDVVATADGVVEFARYGEKYGNYVRIKHSDTYSTQYSHLKPAMVKRGVKITKGQVIGLIGNSGLSTKPHLHYEILKNGTMVDPKHYLPKLPGS